MLYREGLLLVLEGVHLIEDARRAGISMPEDVVQTEVESALVVLKARYGLRSLADVFKASRMVARGYPSRVDLATGKDETIRV